MHNNKIVKIKADAFSLVLSRPQLYATESNKTRL